jgi:hypothetical protein
MVALSDTDRNASSPKLFEPTFQAKFRVPHQPVSFQPLFGCSFFDFLIDGNEWWFLIGFVFRLSIHEYRLKILFEDFTPISKSRHTKTQGFDYRDRTGLPLFP